MSTQVLPIEETELVHDGDKFCHIFCTCRPKVFLCGKYNDKVTVCADYTYEVPPEFCTGCKRPTCKECVSLLFVPCYGCGEI